MVKLGGLAVLNGEGLWTRYEDPSRCSPASPSRRGDRRQRSACSRTRTPHRSARTWSPPGSGRSAAPATVTAVRFSPQHTLVSRPTVLDAGVDLLVVQGTVISAEHVAAGREPLNLKTFIALLDMPVVVGGCTDYQTALHLMRTGAAGVIVGYGAHAGSTTHEVLGIEVPMATAIADAAAARRDYLDETGGRYVHLIAYGDLVTGGDIAKATRLWCRRGDARRGAGAVRRGPRRRLVLGHHGCPSGLPRSPSTSSPTGRRSRPGSEVAARSRPRTRPASATSSAHCAGRWAKCGYSRVKEFQKVELTVDRAYLIST